MRRKLIKQGANSYTITVPIKWVVEQGLSGGDEIEIEEEDSKIVLSPGKGKSLREEKITFDVTDYNTRSIKVLLHQAYRKGYDKIQLTYGTEKQRDAIYEFAQETMLGFEVVHEKDNVIVAQSIAEPSSDRFEVILRKALLIIKEEGKAIQESLKKGEYDQKERKAMKLTFDKLINYSRRVIMKDKVGGTKNSYLMYYLVSLLSLLEHGYYYLHEFAMKENVTCVDKHFLKLYDSVHETYELFYDAFYKKDMALAHKVRTKADDLGKEIRAAIQKKKGVENGLLLQLRLLVRKIEVGSTSFFGLFFEE